jgi:hypothetical protein
MNERIKKFAEQARLLTGWPVGEIEYQKFAEFIVRDCALTAGLMEHEGRKGIGAQILDNYGVKYEQ